MSCNEDFLTDLVEGRRPPIELGDNSIIASNGIGTGILAIDGRRTCLVPNMLLVPRLGKSLLSMGQATNLGYKFVADGDSMTIYSPDRYIPPQGDVIARIPKVDNLYPMRLIRPSSIESNNVVSAGFAKRGLSAIDEGIWHQCLAHINFKDLKRLTKNFRSKRILIRNEVPVHDQSVILRPMY
jgi:hypothetical protein